MSFLMRARVATMAAVLRDLESAETRVQREAIAAAPGVAREEGSEARARILANVRKSLGVTTDRTSDVRVADTRVDLVERRIAERQRHMLPERAKLEASSARVQFSSYLTRGKASVIDVASLADVPVAIATYLRDQNAPPILRIGADERLTSLPWHTASSLEIRRGRAEPRDLVTLSFALAGVAETGTLVLASGPDNPVTLSFMPDIHIVILQAATLVGSYEDGFDIVRATLGAGVMPRTLNLISGPSRTADIGGKTVMGAHGPRHLAVIIVG
jgi:L-lactate dehydrogenase complex protein LldG